MPEFNLSVQDVKPFIGAKDFTESREFHTALGWEIKYDSNSLCVLELGGHRFYLQNYCAKQWCENSMLHVSVADVNAWHQNVNSIFDKNGFDGDNRYTETIRDEGYAHTFHAWDPAGVLIHFAQHKQP